MTEKNIVKDLEDATFSSEIETGVALVDFTATWCGPCKMLAPVFSEVAEDMQDKSNFFKVDIDSCQSTAAKFNVTSVPTLILFKNGQELERSVGVKDHDQLKSMINSAL